MQTTLLCAPSASVYSKQYSMRPLIQPSHTLDDRRLLANLSPIYLPFFYTSRVAAFGRPCSWLCSHIAHMLGSLTASFVHAFVPGSSTLILHHPVPVMLRPLRHLPTPHLPRLRCSPFVQRSPSSQYITISPQCSPFSSSTPVSTSSINRSPDSLIRVLNYPTNPPPPLITSYLSHSRPTYPSLTVPPPPPPYPNDLSSPDGCLSHSAILPDLQSELDRLLHLTYSLAYYSLPYMPPLPAVPTKHAPMLAQANLNLSHAALSNITHHLTESRVRNIDSWAAHYHKIKTDFVKSKKKASKDPKKVTAKSLNSTQRSRLNALYHPPPIAPRIPESPDGVIAVDGIRCNVMASLLECCLYNQVGRVQGNSGGRAATAGETS